MKRIKVQFTSDKLDMSLRIPGHVDQRSGVMLIAIPG